MIEIKCQNCGIAFMIQPSRLKHGRGKCCSRKCQYESMANGPLVTSYLTSCQRCGKEFKTTPSKDAKYCSKECKFPPATTICLYCGREFRYSPSAKKKYCGKVCADKAPEKSRQARVKALQQWQDTQTREKLEQGIKQRSNDPAWYNAPHFQRGDKHPKYKGNKRARLTEVGRYRYKLWHKQVLRQNNFTCQRCGVRGGKLQAHHVMPWADFPDLRYEVSNGQAVCAPCHKAIHHP